jgi:hypothetical protein
MINSDTVSILPETDVFGCMYAILQHASLVTHIHVIYPDDNKWPQGEAGSWFRHIMSILLSYGDVNLELVTLNIENISMHLHVVADPSTIKGLTTSVHFLVCSLWASLLRSSDVAHDDVYWVTTDVAELGRACSDMSAPDAKPTSDTDRNAFAHQALAHNKHFFYQVRQRKLSDGDLAQLRPLLPGNQETALVDSRGRNSLSDEEGPMLPEKQTLVYNHQLDNTLEEFLASFLVDDNPDSDQDKAVPTAKPLPLKRPSVRRKQQLKDESPSGDQDNAGIISVPALSTSEAKNKKRRDNYKSKTQVYEDGDLCASIDLNNRPSTPQSIQYLVQNARRSIINEGNGWIKCDAFDQPPWKVVDLRRTRMHLDQKMSTRQV